MTYQPNAEPDLSKVFPLRSRVVSDSGFNPEPPQSGSAIMGPPPQSIIGIIPAQLPEPEPLYEHMTDNGMMIAYPDMPEVQV